MFPQTLDVMRQMWWFDSVLMFANTIPINCSQEVRQTPKPATTTHLADHLRSQKEPGRPEQHPLQWLKQWHREEFWCDMRMSQNTGKNTKWITQSRFTQHVLKSLHLAYDDSEAPRALCPLCPARCYSKTVKSLLHKATKHNKAHD